MPRMSPLNQNRKIGAIIAETLFPLEFAVAAEVFGLNRPEPPVMRYDFVTVGPSAGVVARSGPLTVAAEMGLDVAQSFHTLIVPGWDRSKRPAPALIKALVNAHGLGVRIASFCSGAFLLAECGLLNGRSATTHWKFAAEFSDRFPAVDLACNKLFVCENGIYTAAGSAAAIDLSLHLVREDYGVEAANVVARHLVSAPIRAGGQAQFIERATPQRAADERLSSLIAALETRLGEALSIGELSKEVGMSRRTFIRRFEAATGATPGQWIAEQRMRRAQSLLEATHLSIDEIAHQCGFSSTGGFRDRFESVVGVSPGAYRRRFFSVA